MKTNYNTPELFAEKLELIDVITASGESSSSSSSEPDPNANRENAIVNWWA